MQQVDIYLRISSQLPRCSTGEYRYKLICKGNEEKPCPGEGETGPISGNRLALTCAIEALSRMTKPAEITVHTDSYYLLNGNASLKSWEKNGWKRKSGKPLRNQELWQKLYDKQSSHTVKYVYDANVDELR